MINIVGRFFRRLVIYQVIFFFAVLKLKDPQKYGNELKDKINTNLASVNLTSDFIDFILQYPETLIKYLTYVEILFAILAVFSLRIGAYVTVALYLIFSLIYFNPILPENRLALFNVKIDLLFSIGVIVVILIECCLEIKKKPKTDDEVEENNEIEEKKDKMRKKKKIE